MFDYFLKRFKYVMKLRAEKLFWAIGYAITSPIYIKDSLGRDVSYCNLTTYDLFDSRCRAVWWNSIRVGESERVDLPMGNVIQAFDYDLAPVMPDGRIDNILNAPIPVVYDNCLKEHGRGTWLLAPEDAQQLANRGIPIMIISKKYNHVAIACPALEWDIKKGQMVYQDYDYNRGVFTGNAGENNDFMFMSDPRGFGAVDWKDTEILYVQFKLYEARNFEGQV